MFNSKYTLTGLAEAGSRLVDTPPGPWIWKSKFEIALYITERFAVKTGSSNISTEVTTLVRKRSILYCHVLVNGSNILLSKCQGVLPVLIQSISNSFQREFFGVSCSLFAREENLAVQVPIPPSEWRPEAAHRQV